MTQFVLTKIAPWPTGRMLALLYLVIGICVSPFFLLAALFAPHESEGEKALSILMGFVFPFLYAFLGLISGLLGGALYNLFARMFGGIPVTFEAAAVPNAPPATFGEQPYGQP